MKQKFGERWTDYVGRNALLYRWIPWFLVVMTVAWIGHGILEILSGSLSDGFVDITLGVLSAIIALIWFERRRYYQIIKAQRKRIDELENRGSEDREETQNKET